MAKEQKQTGVERLKNIIEERAKAAAKAEAEAQKQAERRDREAREAAFRLPDNPNLKNYIGKAGLFKELYPVLKNSKDTPETPFAFIDTNEQGSLEFLDGEGENTIRKTSFDIVQGARLILKNATLEGCTIKISNPATILTLTGNFKETNLEFTDIINGDARLAGDFKECNIKNSFIENNGQFEKARSFFDNVRKQTVIKPLTPTTLTKAAVCNSVITNGAIVNESTLSNVNAQAPLRVVKSDLRGVETSAPLNAEESGISRLNSNSNIKVVNSVILNARFDGVQQCSLLRCSVIDKNLNLAAYGEWIDDVQQVKPIKAVFEQ